MKNIFLLGSLLFLLSCYGAFGDDNQPNRPAESEISIKINIFSDRFLTGLWPQLPEPYRIMALLSASTMIKNERQDMMGQPPAPLVGVSLTIDW